MMFNRDYRMPGLAVLLIHLKRRTHRVQDPALLAETLSDSSEGGRSSEKRLMEVQIDPAEIEICKLPDGSDWLLGEGNFGKV